jgi:hypothetical protein
MATYSKFSYSVNLFFARKSVVALDPPLESNLFQSIMTFPFNVILGVAAVLVIGVVLAFTRKPARSNTLQVDLESQPTQADGAMPKFAREVNLEGHPVQMVEEEMPRSFESNKDGIVKLYNWFYRFAQWRLGGIANNITPRELVNVVSGRIPSEGASALKYIVTCFEIANYSKINLTEEMLGKCLKAVEMLKELVESGGSRGSDDVIELDENSSVPSSDILSARA